MTLTPTQIVEGMVDTYLVTDAPLNQRMQAALRWLIEHAGECEELKAALYHEYEFGSDNSGVSVLNSGLTVLVEAK